MAGFQIPFLSSLYANTSKYVRERSLLFWVWEKHMSTLHIYVFDANALLRSFVRDTPHRLRWKADLVDIPGPSLSSARGSTSVRRG